jgi:hypothetical protein
MPEINKYSGPFQPDLIYNAPLGNPLPADCPTLGVDPGTGVAEGQEVA